MHPQVKTLLIFPGAGNPSQHLYARVYDLIERGALEYGYETVDTSIRWPGQRNDDSEESAALDFHSSLNVAGRHLQIYEQTSTPYDILARSFGTYVALRIATSLRPRFLNRLILWGVPPFWRMWEIYVRDFDATQRLGTSKGVVINRGLFASLEPVESLLESVSYQVTIASGTEDKFSTSADVSYLRALVVNENVRFNQPVKSAPHEVTDEFPSAVVSDYFHALFTHDD